MPRAARSRRAAHALAVGALVLLTACGTDSPDPGATAAGSTGPSTPPATSSGTVPSGTPSGTPAPTAAWTLAGGRVVRGPSGRIKVRLGTSVRLLVTSDRAAEVHVHGYDKEIRVPAGGSAQAAFTADVPGVFEIELHQPQRRLGALQVQ